MKIEAWLVNWLVLASANLLTFKLLAFAVEVIFPIALLSSLLTAHLPTYSPGAALALWRRRCLWWWAII